MCIRDSLLGRGQMPDMDGVERATHDAEAGRSAVLPQVVEPLADNCHYARTCQMCIRDSPCFLRDLDRGIISSSLTAADASSFLAVVEDVPPLDATRAAALSGVFDELLGRGCEVLATCAPSCDAYGPLQHDRLKLSAADLLLSDAELDAARPADDRASRPAAAVPPAERVPGLVWGLSLIHI